MKIKILLIGVVLCFFSFQAIGQVWKFSEKLSTSPEGNGTRVAISENYAVVSYSVIDNNCQSYCHRIVSIFEKQGAS